MTSFNVMFCLYENARNQMETAATCRGSTFGIAMGNDEHALDWQKYNKRARRVKARIHNEKVCPQCAYNHNAHYRTCPERMIK